MPGPVRQPDYLDGDVIHVGGPANHDVHLRDAGTVYRCTASAQTAGRLALYLHKQPVRVFGTSSWIRHDTGGWELQRFFIEDFVPLENKPLREALSELEELASEEDRRG